MTTTTRMRTTRTRTTTTTRTKKRRKRTTTTSDEDGYSTKRTEARLAVQGGSARGPARRRLGHRRVQRRRRQRLPGVCGARRRSAAARLPSPPTAPAIPTRHRQLALRIAREFGLRHEIIHTAGARAPGVPRQPGEPLLLTASTSSTRHLTRWPRRAASRASSTATTPTIAATTGPGRQAAREFGVRSPLDEVGPDQGRNPRAVARAPGCRPGTSRPRRACRRASRTTPKSPTRSCGRSSAPRQRCARSASGSSASGTTTHWRASRSRATRCRAPSSPDVTARLVAGAQGRRLPVRHPGPAGLPAGQPQRGAPVATGIVEPLPRARPRSRSLSASPHTCPSSPRPSKISTRSTSRSASAISTSPTIGRIRRAIPVFIALGKVGRRRSPARCGRGGARRSRSEARALALCRCSAALAAIFAALWDRSPR